MNEELRPNCYKSMPNQQEQAENDCHTCSYQADCVATTEKAILKTKLDADEKEERIQEIVDQMNTAYEAISRFQTGSAMPVHVAILIYIGVMLDEAGKEIAAIEL